ncbi:hypothetical protein GWL_15900 [Herbaspirillum sp. GW103]|nr:hypothetical protein GWL_15900 [Herbaspirillum sp. GW103]
MVDALTAREKAMPGTPGGKSISSFRCDGIRNFTLSISLCGR